MVGDICNSQGSYCLIYSKDISIWKGYCSFIETPKEERFELCKPTRNISAKTGEVRKLEQDGFDMIYQAEIKQFLERERALEANLDKAYALIFGTYCSKYESRIRDDPIELLKTMNVLMHDTVRAKHPYASLYDALMCLFNLKRFKQS